MKNRIARFASAGLAAIISTLCMSVSVAFAKSDYDADYDITEETNFYSCGVYDDKGLFTEEEIEELDSIVQDTAEEINMYVAIYLSDTALSEDSTVEYSDELYEDLFDEDTDGLVYYMDLSEQSSAYDYISTSGRAMLIYTGERDDGSDNRVDKMLDQIFKVLPESGEPIYADDIAAGISAICDQLEFYNDKGPKSGFYAYDSSTGKYIYEKDGETVITSKKPLFALKKYILPSVIVGIITFLISFFSIKSAYKFKKSCSSTAYVESDKTSFEIKEDNFIRQYTTKVKIESSSGGGSHGGGGGGSHGGGGGHR